MLLRKLLLDAVIPTVKFKGLRMILIDQLQLYIENMVINIKGLLYTSIFINKLICFYNRTNLPFYDFLMLRKISFQTQHYYA